MRFAKRWRNLIIIPSFQYSEHARFKSGDFGLEDEERPGQPKSLKMKNWKNYSMKIVAKHKKSSQNLWQTLKQSFLHRIVTGNKKWIHYDKPKRKKSYVKPGQPAKWTAKPNIHGAKVILCIWWDQKGVLYYELLKPGETINGERYRTHLIRLNRAIAEKRPEYTTRHEIIIFHYDNARPRVAIPVKNYLENSG